MTDRLGQGEGEIWSVKGKKGGGIYSKMEKTTTDKWTEFPIVVKAFSCRLISFVS